MLPPFHLLGIDPTATPAEVEKAFAMALDRKAAPEPVLAEARDSILDPARRLLCELTYPIDSNAWQVEAFNEGLSGRLSIAALLPAANSLPPLSKAGFLACVAARQPADTELLIALVEAHAAIEATTAFEVLRSYRSRSGLPMPSLVDTRQALQALLILHSDAVMAGFDNVRNAASPFLACVRQILSNHNRYNVEALSEFLNSYRKSVDTLYLNAAQAIDAACTAIRQHPGDHAIFSQFEATLVEQISPVVPLALFDSHQGICNDEMEKIIARTRLLLADLIAAGDHNTARRIIAVCLGAFSVLPGSIAPFDEVAKALQELDLEARIKPLTALIQSFDHRPAPLGELETRNGRASVSGSRAISYLKTALFVIVPAALMCAAFLTYRHLSSPAPLAAPPPQFNAQPNPEAIPPAGKGERFKIEFVRYCHFQEERLRVIKQHVRGPEDVQAFNMLANDYNSRCSNFYYRDEDLKIVTEEVHAGKQMLEADAMRILSTWPWHTAPDSAVPSAK